MPRAASPDLAGALNAWFADAARPLPWRAAEVSPWAVLVSEFMLQQTQVARVAPKWEAWIERWPTPAALAAEPPSEAVRAWDRLGYPRRALWLHRAAVEIVERHGGEVPSDLDDLLALQGVGPYTARAVAAFAFGLRHPVVDTNTRRVIARAVLGQGEPGPPSTARDLAAMSARSFPSRMPRRARSTPRPWSSGRRCAPRVPRRATRAPSPRRAPGAGPGTPPTMGPRKAGQARFEGSDRQVRGLVMRELRAAHRPVGRDELARSGPDATQLERATAGLVADGLAVAERRRTAPARRLAPRPPCSRTRCASMQGCP